VTENAKLNRKVAKFMGFKYEYNPTPGAKHAYCCPDGSLYSFQDYPNFIGSLDACFKWPVPHNKIPIVGIEFRYYPGGTKCLITYATEGGFDTVESWVKATSKQADYDGEAFKLTPLALCKAIEKLIDK